MNQANQLYRFDGQTFDPDQDGGRLTQQLNRVRNLMLDGHWRSLQEIADLTLAPAASVSARLRDLRKARFGSFIVNRRRRDGYTGLFEYQVIAPRTDEDGQMYLPMESA